VDFRQHQDDNAKAIPDGPTDLVHQALRREINEQISRVTGAFGVAESEAMDVMCECVQTDCTGRIVLTVAEYEAVRGFPTRFLVKTGHDVSATERVVAEWDGYAVVEKSGRSGMYGVRPIRADG
jgi:hypothetical protein